VECCEQQRICNRCFIPAVPEGTVTVDVFDVDFDDVGLNRMQDFGVGDNVGPAAPSEEADVLLSDQEMVQDLLQYIASPQKRTRIQNAIQAVENRNKNLKTRKKKKTVQATLQFPVANPTLDGLDGNYSTAPTLVRTLPGHAEVHHSSMIFFASSPSMMETIPLDSPSDQTMHHRSLSTPSTMTGNSMSSLSNVSSTPRSELNSAIVATQAIEDSIVSKNQSVGDGKKNVREKRSMIWQHGKQISVTNLETNEAYIAWKCNYCSKEFKYSQSKSTSFAVNHLRNQCIEFRKSVLNDNDSAKVLEEESELDGTVMKTASAVTTAASNGTSSVVVDTKKQSILFRNKDGSLGFNRSSENWNPVHLRGLMIDWAIRDDLPFQIFEKPGFLNFMNYVLPMYKTLSARTLREDMVNAAYPQKKIALRKFLQSCIALENTGFCFTTDIYTNTLQKRAYMAITVHFIVRKHNWTLYHTLLSFEQVKSPHTGQNIADKVSKVIEFYGLQKNVFAGTVDNASNNDTMVASLKLRRSEMPLMLDGEFFQNRCNAHCYNLIAQDGISLLKDPLSDIRTFVKCIKTPKNHEIFEERISEYRHASKLASMARPRLDVKTRWNSTHDMIVSVLPYAEIIDAMSSTEIDDLVADPVTQVITPNLT